MSAFYSDNFLVKSSMLIDAILRVEEISKTFTKQEMDDFVECLETATKQRNKAKEKDGTK